MNDKHLDPARTIIAFLGGVDVVSRATGKHITNVYRWMYPRERGGTGGTISHDDARKLIEHARTAGKELRGDDFFDASRLHALLADEADAEAKESAA